MPAESFEIMNVAVYCMEDFNEFQFTVNYSKVIFACKKMSTLSNSAKLPFSISGLQLIFVRRYYGEKRKKILYPTVHRSLFNKADLAAESLHAKSFINSTRNLEYKNFISNINLGFRRITCNVD